MTSEQLIQTEEFKSFLQSAREFCDFVENAEVEDYPLFLLLTQNHLHALYYDVQNIPLVDLNYDLDFDDLLTEVEIGKVLTRIENKLEHRFYRHVFDPSKVEDRIPVCGDLLDDLGDIYKDLKNGLLLFDKQSRKQIEYAVWSFRSDFNIHWGDHCINAIYALHFFRRTVV